MARKTREESLAIKHRILDAAELVLLDKGVAQTAMADLAEAAGMSRGAVYGHYRNKMEVCLAMCDRAFARTSEGFEAGDGLPAFATLRHAASHYLRQCGEPGSMQRVLVILYTKCEQSDENAALLRRRMLLELHAADHEGAAAPCDRGGRTRGRPRRASGRRLSRLAAGRRVRVDDLDEPAARQSVERRGSDARCGLRRGADLRRAAASRTQIAEARETIAINADLTRFTALRNE